ncbi:MAG: serine hydrolase [Fimbriimonas sp.]|nr:serine hydrolase [Fimbriimonas sp.]
MGISWVLALYVPLLATMNQQADSPGVTAIKSFVDCLNANNLSTMERFVDDRFKRRSTTEKELAGRAQRLLDLDSLGAPFAFDSVLEDTTAKVIVLVKNALGQPFEIKMNFDADPPHRALSVYMGGPGSQSAPPPKEYDHWRDLPDLLDQIRTDTKVPAMCLEVVDHGEARLAVSGTRTMSASVKAAASDRWLLGSITKSITATMIARLVDRHVLRWDSTISEILPKMPMREGYRKVTILQLLQHRAGVVQDLYVNPDFLAKAAGENTDRVKMREHYTEFVLSREPIGAPGERMRYSNAGYSVASHLAEFVTGKSYERLVKELVFDPLKMRSALFGVPGQPGSPGGPGQPMGHTFTGDKLEPNLIDDPRWCGTQTAAGAGLSMTIDDLMKFVRYHLAGMRGHATMMSQANFDVLHRPLDLGDTYACGWLITRDLTREPFHGHNGSDGTFRAEMAIWPDRDLAIVAIANAGSRSDPSPPLQAVVAVYNRLDKQRK